MDTPSDRPRNIVLTGFMGTGKSTVGQIVAKRLGWAFVDSDAEIVEQQGMPIAKIFSEHGEPYFRALEREMAKTLAAREQVVIATGGGMLVDSDNRAVMAAHGVVICLNASTRQIARRLRGDQQRPLLKGDWQALFRSRREAYAAVPFQIQTNGLTAEQVADEVVALWQRESM